MDPELRQQLRVEDPMEEPELNLDGLPISSIQVLLEPPTDVPVGGDDEDDDGFYSPLDHFRNLVKLSMSSSQCHSLEGFPPLPLLRSLHLADNQLSSGFEALAEADLQSLVLLDLTANNIQEAAALAPLDALENLQHLMLEGNPVSETQGYREAIFEVLPQLISLDSMDRDGTRLDVDEDALSSGDEGAHFPGNAENDEEYDHDGGDGELEDEDEDIYEEGQPSSHSHHYQPAEDESEDIGSQDEDDEEEYDGEVKHGSDEDEDSDVESGQERPMTGGKTTGGYDQGDEDEDLEDEEDEEDEEEEDEEDGAQYQHTSQTSQQHQQQNVHQIHGSGSEDEEDDDDEEEEDEEDVEEDDEEEEGEEDEEEAPGLAYLLTDDIPDENDDEFEPEADPEEESEMESSDEEEYGSNNNHNKPPAATSGATTPAALAALSNINSGIIVGSSSSSHTNGHSSSTPAKRPRSPELDDGTGIDLTGGFDHGQVGDDVGDGSEFVVDGDDDANGFGMAPFDGPATFDDDSLIHESKRPRT